MEGLHKVQFDHLVSPSADVTEPKKDINWKIPPFVKGLLSVGNGWIFSLKKIPLVSV